VRLGRLICLSILIITLIIADIVFMEVQEREVSSSSSTKTSILHWLAAERGCNWSSKRLPRA
jgi:hypothetical protein